MLSLMHVGFTYGEVFHMSPRDARRYSAIQSAWQIPDEKRDDGARSATAQDAHLFY